MAKSESTIQREVMLELSKRGFTVWRNNVGIGWAGDAQRLESGAMLVRNPRPLRCGLCHGSADLIGFVPIDITGAMVGKTVAQFAAIEVKAKRGVVSSNQRQFLEHVIGNGGLALVARSTEDLPE